MSKSLFLFIQVKPLLDEILDDFAVVRYYIRSLLDKILENFEATVYQQLEVHGHCLY